MKGVYAPLKAKLQDFGGGIDSDEKFGSWQKLKSINGILERDIYIK
jgi:hypothetical protein